jgi:RNase P subunit RPR2
MKAKEKTKTQVSVSWSCPTCGQSTYESLGENPSTEFSGTLPDGRTYKMVTRERVKCTCGQCGIIMRYVG